MIRLLIADDSALMRKLLEGIFIAEGDFDIRMARNGNEALEIFNLPATNRSLQSPICVGE